MRARPEIFLLLLVGALGCVREEREPAARTAAPAAISPPNEQELIPSDNERNERNERHKPVEEGMPGPHRRRLEAAVALNATCEACHKDEADEWRRSRHRESNTNAAYRAAFAIEPSAFCRSCHAPEADPIKIPPRAVSELGVGCVTCHVTDEGLVLAAASFQGNAPHPLKRSVDFARTGGCSGCHEFRFPGAIGHEDGHFMQTTAREHESSPGAEKACADCHMPLVAGRRSHAFAAVRDPAWLRENLQVTASLSAEDNSAKNNPENAKNRVRVTLVQPDPGHAFPTGDLFRRLEVGCEIRDASGKVVQREVRHLARHFEILPGRSGRVLVRDDRVFDEPNVVEFELAPPERRPATVAWWVSLQRVATVGTGANPADAKIESSVPLHSGVLPWELSERSEREP